MHHQFMLEEAKSIISTAHTGMQFMYTIQHVSIYAPRSIQVYKEYTALIKAQTSEHGRIYIYVYIEYRYIYMYK